MSQFRTITVYVEGGPDARNGRPHRRGPQKCNGCGQPIWWCLTHPNLKPIPFDHNPVAIETDGDLATIATKGVHWETCPARDKFRKPAPSRLFS